MHITEPTIDVSELINREAIRDCLARYCRGIDRRCVELIRSSFWPDATDDHSIFVGNLEEFLAWVMSMIEPMALTQHNLGHSLIRIRGNQAVVETNFTAYHRVGAGQGQKDIILSGRYVDKMEKRQGMWRIIRRFLLNDWFRDLGASFDWENGPLGQKFFAESSIGKSHDDHSEQLFEDFFGRGSGG